MKGPIVGVGQHVIGVVVTNSVPPQKLSSNKYININKKLIASAFGVSILGMELCMVHQVFREKGSKEQNWNRRHKLLHCRRRLNDVFVEMNNRSRNIEHRLSPFLN